MEESSNPPESPSPWASPGYAPAASEQTPPAAPPEPARPDPSHGIPPQGHAAPPQTYAAPTPGFSPPAGGHGAPGQGHYTFPSLEQPKLDPLAPASILTAPIAPLGLGLGITSLRRIRQQRLRGKGLATTGVILSSLFLAASLLTLGTFALDGTFARMVETPVPGDVPSARTAAPVNLDVGNCVVTLPVGNEVGEVSLTPCADEHQYQVIDRVAATGEAYPEVEELFAEASEVCQNAFDAISAEDPARPASHTPWHLVPSAENWADGDRNIICLARSTAGPVTDDLVNE